MKKSGRVENLPPASLDPPATLCAHLQRCGSFGQVALRAGTRSTQRQRIKVDFLFNKKTQRPAPARHSPPWRDDGERLCGENSGKKYFTARFARPACNAMRPPVAMRQLRAGSIAGRGAECAEAGKRQILFNYQKYLSDKIKNIFVLPLRPLRLCGKNSSSGFSLVEVSLALLIIGIGMLAILSMFPTGLDQNARSISDTQAALFAEEVFSSLRVYAETNWEGIGGATVQRLPVAGSNNWYNSGDLAVWLDNEMATNIYRHFSDSNIVDHAFRYRITLATNGLIKSAFLRFWPGQFGTTNSPTLFYSEFFKLNP